MAQRETLRAATEQAAFRSVKRACYAGLDSVTLRMEVARRAAPAIPTEARTLSTVDPDTALLTHVVAEGLPPSFARTVLQVVYPHAETERVIALLRTGRVVSASPTDEFCEAMRAAGFRCELLSVLSTEGVPWGVWCTLRETGSPPFSDREMRFLRRVAPHFARGLKAAALIETARMMDIDAVPEHAGAAATTPGVIILDARGQITVQSVAATAQLADIADVGIRMEDLPCAVASVVGRLYTKLARSPDAADHSPLDAELRVRGRSGRWYHLLASLAEPDASGESASIVVITPMSRGEVAPILTRLYGLSPREREVLSRVALGDSTREIAERLGISAYTVQDHLDHAFDKVGVRGRRALLAKLFFDGYASRLLG